MEDWEVRDSRILDSETNSDSYEQRRQDRQMLDVLEEVLHELKQGTRLKDIDSDLLLSLDELADTLYMLTDVQLPIKSVLELYKLLKRDLQKSGVDLFEPRFYVKPYSLTAVYRGQFMGSIQYDLEDNLYEIIDSQGKLYPTLNFIGIFKSIAWMLASYISEPWPRLTDLFIPRLIDIADKHGIKFLVVSPRENMRVILKRLYGFQDQDEDHQIVQHGEEGLVKWKAFIYKNLEK